MTRARLLAGITFAVMSAAAVPAPWAAATTYYEYWSYWHKAPGATSWQYSSVGASGYYLKAGAQVEGWRYAIGTASPGDPQPRPTDVSYDAYCAGKNTDKTYRVLLVVDYGTMSGAPSGPVYSCYGFDNDPNGLQVLTQQHTERDSSGLICAIDSYPKTGCGDTVSSPAPRPTPARTTNKTQTTTQPSTATPTHAPAASAAAAATAGRTTTSPRPLSPRATVTPGSAAPSQPSASTSDQPTPRLFAATTARSPSFPSGLVIGLAGLAALIGGALWMRRRNS